MRLSTKYRTPIELYREGVEALNRALGPVESIRFLRLIDPGKGDYTAERQARLDQDKRTLDEICEQIRAAAQRRLSSSK